jgi:hypothetical protein
VKWLLTTPCPAGSTLPASNAHTSPDRLLQVADAATSRLQGSSTSQVELVRHASRRLYVDSTSCNMAGRLRGWSVGWPASASPSSWWPVRCLAGAAFSPVCALWPDTLLPAPPPPPQSDSCSWTEHLRWAGAVGQTGLTATVPGRASTAHAAAHPHPRVSFGCKSCHHDSRAVGIATGPVQPACHIMHHDDGQQMRCC